MKINGFKHKITWDEFEEVSQVPHGSPKHSAAYTFADFSYRYPRTKWISGNKCKIEELSVTIMMDKRKSWVLKGKKNSDLLQHEQIHYDITAIGARDLFRLLKELTDNCNSLNNKANEIEKKIQKKINKYNKRYDNQTNHGLNTAKQKHWISRIRTIKVNKKGEIDQLP